jgi:hypothetical protein
MRRDVTAGVRDAVAAAPGVCGPRSGEYQGGCRTKELERRRAAAFQRDFLGECRVQLGAPSPPRSIPAFCPAPLKMKLKMTANQTQSRLIVPNQVILWLEMASIAPRQCPHWAIFAGYFSYETAKRPQTVKPSQTQSSPVRLSADEDALDVERSNPVKPSQTQSNPCLSVLRFPRPAFQTVKPGQTQSNRFLTSTIHHRIIPSLRSARSRPQAPFPMKSAIRNPSHRFTQIDTDSESPSVFICVRLWPIRNPQWKRRTTDGHGWTRMGRVSRYPRSSAFIRRSNPQSAIRATDSHRLTQIRSPHLCLSVSVCGQSAIRNPQSAIPICRLARRACLRHLDRALSIL